MDTLGNHVEETERIYEAIKDANARHFSEDSIIMFSTAALNEMACIIRSEEIVMQPRSINLECGRNEKYMYDPKDRKLYDEHLKAKECKNTMFISINTNGVIGSCVRARDIEDISAYNTALLHNYYSNDISAIVVCDFYKTYYGSLVVVINFLYNKNHSGNTQILKNVKNSVEEMCKTTTWSFKEDPVSTTSQYVISTMKYIGKMIMDKNDGITQEKWDEFTGAVVHSMQNTLQDNGIPIVHKLVYIGKDYAIEELLDSTKIIAFAFVGWDENINKTTHIEMHLRDTLKVDYDIGKFINGIVDNRDKNGLHVLYTIIQDKDDDSITVTLTIY